MRTIYQNITEEDVSNIIKKVLSEKKVLKIKKKTSEPNIQQTSGIPEMPADPAMSGNPTMDSGMGGDMPTNPAMDSEMPTDAAAMGDDPTAMGNDMPADTALNGDSDKKDIQKNIGKACEDFRNYQGEDKEELKKWIEGMLDSLDSDGESEEPTEEDPQNGMPMEVIFTKKQVAKLNEIFGQQDVEKINKPLNKKKKGYQMKSPFSSPNIEK